MIIELLREELSKLYENRIIAYHGSKNEFDNFSLEYVGKGIDQNGPGFYFTTSEKEAQTHGDVKKYQLDLNKTVSLTKPPKKEQVIFLMKNAPELNDVLDNWGENYNVAFKYAFNEMMDQGSAKEVFEQVWYDFYRNHPEEYIKNMIKLGYDGIIIPMQWGDTHYIVFNPNKIVKV